MTTIKEAWGRGESALVQAGIESARLDAQILLCFVLDIQRSVLYAYPERLVSPEQEQRYLALIERRYRHEPIAYIIGHKEFYGRDFYVDPRVLIPRPETELLMEIALASITQRLGTGQVPIVADIGTGSGIIPVTIAVEVLRLPYIYGCDISSTALEVARTNVSFHHVEDRVRLLQGDLVAPLPESVDVLVANLPYVGINEMIAMAEDVVAYEPHVALFSGQYGLHLLQRFFTDVKRLSTLNQDGEMILEIGYRQGEVVARWIQELWPSAHVSVHKDYAGADRFVLARL